MNKIATAIKVIAWLSIVGAIFIGIGEAKFEDSFWIFITYILYGIGVATLLF
jgi:hypothetical protein